MIPPLYHTCAASHAVTALLGSPPRIYLWGEHDGKPQYPYVTYTADGTPGNYLAQRPDSEAHSLTLDVWAKTANSADAVAAALRAAIEPHSYVRSVRRMGRDAETKSYRLRLEVDWATV